MQERLEGGQRGAQQLEKRMASRRQGREKMVNVPPWLDPLIVLVGLTTEFCANARSGIASGEPEYNK